MSKLTYLNFYVVNINEEDLSEDYRKLISSYKLQTPLDLMTLHDKVKNLVGWVVGDGFRGNFSGYDSINYVDIYIIDRENVNDLFNLIDVRVEDQFKVLKIDLEDEFTSEIDEGCGELHYYYLEDISEEEISQLSQELKGKGVEIHYKSEHISFLEKGASGWGEAFIIGIASNIASNLIPSFKKPRNINKAKFDIDNLIRNVGHNLGITAATLKVKKIEPSSDHTVMNIVLEDRNNYYSVSCDSYECNLEKSSNCRIETSSKADTNTSVS